MGAVLRKELIQFFGSLTGYVVAVVFLVITSLFLWVFEGNYNIFEAGYATLSSLFDLAPWIFLFLVPAVTMRMFAEERKSGTIELLLSRPVSAVELVAGKFMAAFVVVVICLLPTLVWFLSVYLLGNPVGAIDSGATVGSYAGLLFLAAIYIAIGLFTSSVTDNQMVGFLLSVLISFFWLTGFDFLAELQWHPSIADFLASLGIMHHYQSISRGVADSRDLLYFILTALLFGWLTVISLSWRRKPVKQLFTRMALVLSVGAVIFILSSKVFFRIDFTSGKRYTLSERTLEILRAAEAPIGVELYLEGDMPLEFKRLQREITDKLIDMRRYSAKSLIINHIDPYKSSSASERKSYFESLMKRGILPTDLRIKTDQGVTTRWIFPSAIIKSGEYEVAVNFLRNDPSRSAEENLNNSIEMLEYELVRALSVLFQHEKRPIAVLQGHDELDEWQLKDLTNALTERYDVSFLTADRLAQRHPMPDALIIARPESSFSEPDKFTIDQYLMRGGNILWLVDPVGVSLDSLSSGMSTLAFPRDLNLNDQLFHYGFRLNNNLLQDAECLQIRVNTALAGQPPKYSLAPWYFSPLLHPSNSHPAVRGVNRVMGEFVSSIDILDNNPKVRYSVLLTTSPYARSNNSPMMVSLGMIDAPPARELFNTPNIPVGVLAEGEFSSVFRNRMVGEMGIASPDQVLTQSRPARIALFADGSLVANKVNRSGEGGRILPLGFDRVSSVTFGNKEYFVNLINYLCDEDGIMELRSRTMKLRLLDKVKLHESKRSWQLFNIAFPVLLILLGGALFYRMRKWRNGKFIR